MQMEAVHAVAAAPQVQMQTTLVTLNDHCEQWLTLKDHVLIYPVPNIHLQSLVCQTVSMRMCVFS